MTKIAKHETKRAANSVIGAHMTPEAFKDIRAQLGYSQVAFAEVLGIHSDRTIQRYEAGASSIPLHVVLLLKSVGAMKA